MSVGFTGCWLHERILEEKQKSPLLPFATFMHLFVTLELSAYKVQQEEDGQILFPGIYPLGLSQGSGNSSTLSHSTLRTEPPTGFLSAD